MLLLASLAAAADCGTLELVGTPTTSPVRVWLDGTKIGEVAPWAFAGTALPLVLLPTCGLRTLRVDWGPGDPGGVEEVAVPLAAGLHLRQRQAAGWIVRDKAPAPRCLRLDPPTFGWRCHEDAVPPERPYDLAMCTMPATAGDAKRITAEAKNEPPIEATLLPSLPGVYTASVKDGAIRFAWVAEAGGCGG